MSDVLCARCTIVLVRRLVPSCHLRATPHWHRECPVCCIAFDEEDAMTPIERLILWARSLDYGGMLRMNGLERQVCRMVVATLHAAGFA